MKGIGSLQRLGGKKIKKKRANSFQLYGMVTKYLDVLETES